MRPTELKTSLEGATATPIGGPPAATPEATSSSSERAAASVTARLKTILPEESAFAEPEPFPTDPMQVAVEPPPARDASEAARASVRSIFDQTRDDPERAGVAPLAILGLIGFSLFAGGLYWAFVSRPSGGLIGSPIIGFALGFLGIVCVGSSVYFLLERLGGDSDQG